MKLNLIQKLLVIGLFTSAASQLYLKKHIVDSFPRLSTEIYRYTVEISGVNFFVPYEIYLWQKFADYGFLFFLLSYVGYFYYRKSL